MRTNQRPPLEERIQIVKDELNLLKQQGLYLEVMFFEISKKIDCFLKK